MSEQPIWAAENLNLSIGRQIIFKNGAFAVGATERVALIGRNGCGKSTLLRIIAGLESPGGGDISVAKGTRISYMPQDPVLDTDQTVGKVVAQGLDYFEKLLADYNRLPPESIAYAQIEHQLNYHQAWNLENQLAAMIDRLELEPDRQFSQLSGGEARRALLARAIIAEPDLLLLDEPTNHLDVDTINWIENFLSSYRGACLFVTHDRYFLDRVANRIVELGNGEFFSCAGTYADFLEAKAACEYAEDMEAEKRAKFLRLEAEWVCRSPKARLRRNLGRLRRFNEISEIEGPKRVGNVELVIPAPPRLGNKAVEIKNGSFEFDNRKIIDNFSCEFTAGTKTGIIGPNGIGKTTLLKLITGQLTPSNGTISVADTVVFNYIDQSRIELNPNQTVIEAVAGDLDYVNLGDGKISVWGYLKRFLFEDERINTQVKYLSGGEKARLLLAIVMKRGGNFLILDEPTNDLDLSTLRVLEESLRAFCGSLIVVSHDRYFLNRVCNRIIAFSDSGITLTPGDYDYYIMKERERQGRIKTEPVKKVVTISPRPVQTAKKLTYRETQELDGMEEAIAIVEKKISALETEFTAPDFYTTRAKDAPLLQAAIEEAKNQLDVLYRRWDELENKKSAFK